jgi:hypothetical protein
MCFALSVLPFLADQGKATRQRQNQKTCTISQIGESSTVPATTAAARKTSRLQGKKHPI